MFITSKSLEETKEAAEALVRELEIGEGATVVALEGDLGSGKTFFTQAVGEILGVKSGMQSPTFVIEKIYPIDYKGFKHLIHIDAYRLEKESELVFLGWDEILKRPENLILIEWPDRVPNLIPKEAKRMFFKFIDDHTREIKLHEEKQ